MIGAVWRWLVFGDWLAQAVLCVAAGLLLRDLLAAWYRLGREPEAASFPPISILKPVHGWEPAAEPAFRSWCTLDYAGEWELIFVCEDATQPLYPLMAALAEESAPRVRLVLSGPNFDRRVNGKSHNLAAAARSARYNWLLIADSDTLAEPAVLRRFAAALDERSGAVSATPRVALAHGLPARLEQALVNHVLAPFEYARARLRGAQGLWGTLLLVRRECVDAAGGFGALGRVLCEDVALERAVRPQGRSCGLLRRPVDVMAPPLGWGDLLRHWHRWLVGLRRMKPLEYGCMALILLAWLLPIAALCTLIARPAATDQRLLALALFAAVAVASPIITAVAGIGTIDSALAAPLLPLAVAVLTAAFLWSLASTTVLWRGRRRRVRRGGWIETADGIEDLAPARPASGPPAATRGRR